MEEVRSMMGDGPVYISFDIDGLDPAFAPGTGMIKLIFHRKEFFVLFDLILYVPSTVFQLLRDGSSWVEPVLS